MYVGCDAKTVQTESDVVALCDTALNALAGQRGYHSDISSEAASVCGGISVGNLAAILSISQSGMQGGRGIVLIICLNSIMFASPAFILFNYIISCVCIHVYICVCVCVCFAPLSARVHPPVTADGPYNWTQRCGAIHSEYSHTRPVVGE
jgi:hypothetical protein